MSLGRVSTEKLSGSPLHLFIPALIFHVYIQCALSKPPTLYNQAAWQTLYFNLEVTKKKKTKSKITPPAAGRPGEEIMFQFQNKQRWLESVFQASVTPL